MPKRRIPLFVSVDWDLAIKVPYDNPLTNAWHRAAENGYQDVEWAARFWDATVRKVDIEPLTPLVIHPVHWWEQFRQLAIHPACRVTVSESHVSAFDHAADLYDRDGQALTVWNFDAHGDLGGYRFDAKADQLHVACGDWLGVLMARRMVKQAVLQYPAWRLRDGIENEPLDKWSERFRGRLAACTTCETAPLAPMSDLLKRVEVVGVHICRSGAWTPPYHDPAFVTFVQSCPLGTAQVVDAEDQGNPMIVRKYPSVRELREKWELLSTMKATAI